MIAEPSNVELRGDERAGVTRLALSGIFALCLLNPVGAGADQTKRLRVGALQFGTVNWELDVIQRHGLAARQGVDLQLVPLGSKSATNVAVQGGAVDVIVSDWIWVSRQRAEGRRYAFVPYSLAVGALMVRPDAGVRELRDLRGKRLGVAGGPVDKSWLLLRAYAQKTLGEDLMSIVEPNFVAPPLLNQLMLRGQLPAGLNFWHYGARLKAAGMQELVQVTDVLKSLGVDRPVPLLGWVFDEEWASSHGELLNGFLRASYAAKRILVDSDAEWLRLKPRMKVTDDATLYALRDAYRAGVPRRFGAAEIEAARRVFEILAEIGGNELVGSSSRLSDGTFWGGYEMAPW
jgi:NitT/TauT family transport system substrate-binding protein